MTKQESLTLSLALFALLSKVRKQGLMSIECDVECPNDSDIMKSIPGDVQPLVCDLLRLMIGGNLESEDLREYAKNMIDNTPWLKDGTSLRFAATTLVYACKGYAPQIAIEFARSTIPQKNRPTFDEVEKYIKEHKYDFDRRKEDDTFEGRVFYVMKLLGVQESA